MVWCRIRQRRASAPRGVWYGSEDLCGDTFGESELQLFKSIDMKKYCESIPFETRVLLTHGLDDVRVPPEDSARFATSIVNMTQHLLPNCDHGYKGTEVVESLYAVFKEWYLRDAERHTERRLHAARKGKGKLYLSIWGIGGTAKFRSRIIFVA